LFTWPFFHFFLFSFFQITHTENAGTDFDTKQSKDAILCKDVLFGVTKPEFNIWTPFFLKTVILGPDFDGTSKIFAQKLLYHWACLHLNGS